MTIHEAIRTIECAKAEVEWNYPLDYAVAFDMAARALEMQIPMKPINIGTSWEEYLECPICHKPATDYYGCKMNYCRECGQKIDWRKEE